jgi:hypothetical protein
MKFQEALAKVKKVKISREGIVDLIREIRESNFTEKETKQLQEESNINCVNCVNCWFCINCVNCTGCKSCKDCKNCKNCIGCKGYKVCINRIDCTEFFDLNASKLFTSSLKTENKSTNVFLNKVTSTIQDREGVHGDSNRVLTVIAKLWNAYLESKEIAQGTKKLEPIDVCFMMDLFKQGRLFCKPTEDGFIDKVGYSALAYQEWRNTNLKSE